MNYQDIQRVNSEMKMLDLKGKDYAMVPERVTAFRKLYPEGLITTEIIEHDGTTVLMQAKAGYYDGSTFVLLGTGLAQEVKGKGMVNGTSYIENCETSAVGRALGFLGLGINGGGICSAEELANAVTAQRQMAEEKQDKKDEYAEMATVRTQILGLAKGDIDALNGLIEKWSQGKYLSLDGMPLADMKNLKLAIVKAKQGADK